MSSQWLDRIPHWSIFAGTILVVLLSIAAGYMLGAWRRRRAEEAISGPVGSVVAALLGLLAFILAFTFGVAASRFDTRKELLLTEVNAIETAFLRAALIAEPHRSECRDLLKRYAADRALLGSPNQNIPEIILRAEDLQNQLWNHAIALSSARSNPEIDALFIDSLNSVIDLHTMRVINGLQYRIPMGVWNVLFFLTVCTMAAVGYQFGLAGKNSFIIYLILAVGYSLIITVIVDLDNATRGKLRVGQRPMVELSQRLNAAKD